jgi:hypothetical protein
MSNQAKMTIKERLAIYGEVSVTVVENGDFV